MEFFNNSTWWVFAFDSKFKFRKSPSCLREYLTCKCNFADKRVIFRNLDIPEELAVIELKSNENVSDHSLIKTRLAYYYTYKDAGGP